MGRATGFFWPVPRPGEHSHGHEERDAGEQGDEPDPLNAAAEQGLGGRVLLELQKGLLQLGMLRSEFDVQRLLRGMLFLQPQEKLCVLDRDPGLAADRVQQGFRRGV
jgi:hypothetical protein